MTLNAVMALILRFFHGIRQIFRPIIITVVEGRPILSVKYCLPGPVLYIYTFGENYNAPCSAVSLR